MKPGQMALQVIPDLAVSKATTLVSPIIPNLVVQYADFFYDATIPCALAILMILPHFFSFMEGKTSLIV